MMWFTADLHLGDTNILHDMDRPFDSVEEMNRKVIDAINECVATDDRLYILGDFTYRLPLAEAVRLRERIECQNVTLIRGNHDGDWVRLAACIPAGVAALPSPSRLALTLALRAASVSSSRPAWGSRRRRTGRSRRLSPAAMPLRRISSSTPDHRHSAPAMTSTSSTAAAAPSSAAAVTADRRPLTAPYTRDTVTISVQNIPITTPRTSLREKSTRLSVRLFAKILDTFRIVVDMLR